MLLHDLADRVWRFAAGPITQHSPRAVGFILRCQTRGVADLEGILIYP
jgi:hypothetical protein